MTPKNTGRFGKGNPGKPKGAVAKVPADLRAMVLTALSEAGGAEYLTRQAKKKNPAPFLALVGKCIPKDVQLTATVTLTDLLREAEARRRSRG